MRKGIAAATILTAALAAAPAQAVRYASPTGNPAADCATTATACNIEAAVEGNAAGNPVAGEEIILLPGSYTNAVEVTAAGTSNLNIHGALDQPAPTVTTSGRFLISDDTLSYIRFQSSTVGDTINMNDGTIDRVFVTSGSSGGSPACQCYGGVIRNSVFVATGASPAIGVTSNGGSGSPIYRNVTAYSTNASTPAFRVLQVDPVMGIHNFTAVNVVALNSAGGPEVVADGPNSEINFDHSNYRNVATADFGIVEDAPGSPHQTAMPLFANPAGADFSQLAGSPTIDAGLTGPANGTTDFAGNPRTAGASTDIGADEYEPPPSQPGKSTKKCKKKRKKGKKKRSASAAKKKKRCKKKRKKKRR